MQGVERGHVAGAGPPLELVQVDEPPPGLGDLQDEGPSVAEHARVDVLAAHAVEEVLLPVGHLQSDVPDDLLHGGLVHLALAVAVGASLAVALPAGPYCLGDLAAVLVVAAGDEERGDVQLDLAEAGVHQGDDLGVLELHRAVHLGEGQLPDLAVQLGFDGFGATQAVLVPYLLLLLDDLGLDPGSDQEVVGFDVGDAVDGGVGEPVQQFEDILAQGTELGRRGVHTLLGQGLADIATPVLIGGAGADLAEHASKAVVAQSHLGEPSRLVIVLVDPLFHGGHLRGRIPSLRS